MKSILIIGLLILSVFADDTAKVTKIMNEIEISSKVIMYDNTAEGIFAKGFSYMEGIDTEQNTQKGLALYIKSSKIGYRMAQETLAYMYCTGDKVEKDLKQCAYWANRADYKHLWNKYELWNYISHGKR